LQNQLGHSEGKLSVVWTFHSTRVKSWAQKRGGKMRFSGFPGWRTTGNPNLLYSCSVDAWMDMGTLGCCGFDIYLLKHAWNDSQSGWQKVTQWYVKRKLGSAFFIWHKAACRKGCIYLPEHAVLEVTLTRNLLNIRPARLSHWNILTRHPASSIENLCSETFFSIFSSTFFFFNLPSAALGI